MRRIIFLLILGMFLASPPIISAQMMGGRRFDQNAKSDCAKDDSYFEKLGDQSMEEMMGKEQDKLMEERMGEKWSREMHIRMGKMVSGCDGGWGTMIPMGWGMMGGWSMMDRWAGGLVGWYWLVVQVLVLIILGLLTVYLWRKIKKEIK